MACFSATRKPLRRKAGSASAARFKDGMQVCQISDNINYEMSFHDRYTSKRPGVEFRCQFPAERIEFRCRGARPNCTQAADFLGVFDAERVFFGGGEGFSP